MKERGIIAGLLFLACAAIVFILSVKGFNTAKKEVTEQQAAVASAAGLGPIVKEAKDKLPATQRAYVDSVEKFSTAPDTVLSFDALRKLVKFWDSTGQLGVSAYYYQKIANKNPMEWYWDNVAERYYYQAATSEDTTRHHLFMDQARQAYKKVVEINPKNLDAKTKLAICISENRADMMQGIGLLREVLAADSNHIGALYQIGMFSIESQQYDKALQRFKKLVSLQPFNSEFYFQLAEVYKLMGMNAEAEKNYEISKTLVKEKEARELIDKKINEVKRH